MIRNPHDKYLLYKANSNYTRFVPLWNKVEMCFEGEDSIKRPDNMYEFLPPTPAEWDELRERTGQYETSRPNEGNLHKITDTEYFFRYAGARFENFFEPICWHIVGLMQTKEPSVSFGNEETGFCPPEVQSLNVYGNSQGDTLRGLKMRLNFDQVLYGRYGLLLELKTDRNGRNEKFSITEYPCWKILDGDTIEAESGKSAVGWALLDESSKVFNPQTKGWECKPRRRVVGLDRTQATPRYYQAILDGDGVDEEWIRMDVDNPLGTLPANKVIFPAFRGRTIDFVPLTICNVSKLGISEWQYPPLLTLANIALGHYQMDSHQKYALAKHACPTVVISNHKPPTKENARRFRTGGIVFLHSENPSSPVSASYLETSGAGFSEYREVKREIRESTKYSSVQEVLNGAGANSSAAALSLRTSVGTAYISHIDQTGGRAIEEQLIYAAIFAGATPDQAAERIEFRPDTSYLNSGKTVQEVVAMMTANRTSGTPFLSNRNLYELVSQAAGEGTLSSYEDNEIQVQEDLLADYAVPDNAPPDEDKDGDDEPEDNGEENDEEPEDDENRKKK